MRDKMGLTLLQKRVLVNLLEEPDWRIASDKAGVERWRIGEWLKKDKPFRAAYDDLFAGVLAESRAKLTTLMPRVGDVFEEGLRANEAERLDVECPECGHKFELVHQGPAWGVRLRVSEDLLKVHGEMVQHHVIEGEITTRNLTLEDMIARAVLSRGGEVPPQVAARLQEVGLLQEGALEGEYTPLPEDSPDTPDESA